MPIEFKQTAMPQGSTDNELYKLEMKYDGSGRRISKTVWRKAVGAENWQKNQVTHYTGIGTEIRENYHNESLEKAKVVVNMPEGLGRYGIEDAVTPYSNINSFEWYLKNNLGSTMLVYGTVASTNPNEADIGEKIAAYDYRAFGEMVELTPPATGKVTENFTGSRFARRTQRTACKSIAEPKNLGAKRNEHDDEIALNYFGARYLDPMLGMWTSVDPARQFASPYLYAGNGMNPINAIDPDGNFGFIFAIPVWKLITGSVLVAGGSYVAYKKGWLSDAKNWIVDTYNEYKGNASANVSNNAEAVDILRKGANHISGTKFDYDLYQKAEKQFNETMGASTKIATQGAIGNYLDAAKTGKDILISKPKTDLLQKEKNSDYNDFGNSESNVLFNGYDNSVQENEN